MTLAAGAMGGAGTQRRERRLRDVVAGALVAIARIGAAWAMLVLFGFGVLMLETLLPQGVVPALLGIATLPAVALCLIGGKARWVHLVAIWVPAVLVPVIGLLGVDVVTASLRWGHPPLGLGLLIASVVVGGLTFLFLRWLPDRPRVPEVWTVSGVAGALAVYVVTRGHLDVEGEIWGVAAALGVATELYLRFLAGPTVHRPLGWAGVLIVAVVFMVPVVIGATEAKHPGVAAIVGLAALVTALSVDTRQFARDRPAAAARLRGLLAPALAAAVALAVVGVALSRTPASHGPTHRLPPAGGPATVPWYAVAHRPLLRFDSDEQLRTPVDVDALLSSGHVSLCPVGTDPFDTCPTLGGAGDLRNKGDLRFETSSFDNGSFATRIYVHVVDDIDPAFVDLDYWWYLPNNPANTARGAMCGAGLAIPEITCFDHQSDWEGVTVVVDARTYEPKFIHYAAHNFVVRVPWSVAEAAGRRFGPKVGVRPGDLAGRPLVFVALGTHAAYPRRCVTDFCTGVTTKDNRFDGGNGWAGNESCAGCVAPFPVTKAGEPASWNAFPGRWGTALCIARDLFCGRTDAPRSPYRQNGRFAHPWCFTHVIRRDDLRPAPAHVRCVGRPAE